LNGKKFLWSTSKRRNRSTKAEKEPPPKTSGNQQPTTSKKQVPRNRRTGEGTEEVPCGAPVLRNGEGSVWIT
jgi:hypothetical protein